MFGTCGWNINKVSSRKLGRITIDSTHVRVHDSLYFHRQQFDFKRYLMAQKETMDNARPAKLWTTRGPHSFTFLCESLVGIAARMRSVGVNFRRVAVR